MRCLFRGLGRRRFNGRCAVGRGRSCLRGQRQKVRLAVKKVQQPLQHNLQRGGDRHSQQHAPNPPVRADHNRNQRAQRTQADRPAQQPRGHHQVEHIVNSHRADDNHHRVPEVRERQQVERGVRRTEQQRHPERAQGD